TATVFRRIGKTPRGRESKHAYECEIHAFRFIIMKTLFDHRRFPDVKWRESFYDFQIGDFHRPFDADEISNANYASFQRGNWRLRRQDRLRNLLVKKSRKQIKLVVLKT